MDWGAWWATVHGVANSRTRLSDFTCLQHSTISFWCIKPWIWLCFISLELFLYYSIADFLYHLSVLSCLGNPMDSGACWAIVHGITRVGHDLVTKSLSILYICQPIFVPWKFAFTSLSLLFTLYTFTICLLESLISFFRKHFYLCLPDSDNFFSSNFHFANYLFFFSFWFYWGIIDIQYYISLRHTASWFALYTVWSDYHNKFSEHSFYHIDTKLKKWKKCFFPLWWELLGFTL